ncbi:hypothetical protein, partial [Corynebacterium sp. HMSC058E07]|uniref:hypothetical protein n=1 Tax=Corynebacterium sp. HMSC058E07 TaxID=1715157 RepID=UPI003529F0B9
NTECGCSELYRRDHQSSMTLAWVRSSKRLSSRSSSGIRWAEMTALRIDSIDFDTRRFDIHRTDEHDGGKYKDGTPRKPQTAYCTFSEHSRTGASRVDEEQSTRRSGLSIRPEKAA